MSEAIVKYAQREEAFFHALTREFGADLLLYCVIGGLGRGEIIDGWSDIDILLVFDGNFDQRFFERFSPLIGKTSSIKIGTTFYTLSEFQDRVSKDAKTLHSVSLIKKGVYVPRILNERIHLQEKDLSHISEYDRVDFSAGLHDLKRIFLTYPDMDEKKIVKTIYKMMKILLRSFGCACYGYRETEKQFLHIFPEFTSFVKPETVVDRTITREERYQRYIAFLCFLDKHLIQTYEKNLF